MLSYSWFDLQDTYQIIGLFLYFLFNSSDNDFLHQKAFKGIIL
jgi:hypothetical protein